MSAGLSAKEQTLMDMIVQEYNSIDKNGDGNLSREETKRFIGICFNGKGKAVSEKQVDEYIALIDQNKSGTIEKDEYIQYAFDMLKEFL